MIIISTKNVPQPEQHSHAHSLLRSCLKTRGIDYAEGQTPLIFGEHGKPALAEHPKQHFNVSHAQGIAAAIVSDCECGIDCERVRAYRPRVMLRCFSEKERAAVEGLPESERDLMFFRFWTLKEAYVKAIGRGLAFPLSDTAFELVGGRIVTNLVGCSFAQYLIGGEFVVSVCEMSDRLSGRVAELPLEEEEIVI